MYVVEGVLCSIGRSAGYSEVLSFKYPLPLFSSMSSLIQLTLISYCKPSEGNVPNVDEKVMSGSASETSVKSEGDASEHENEAAGCTSVKSKPRHRKIKNPEKEPKDRKKQKKQKKREREQ